MIEKLTLKRAVEFAITTEQLGRELYHKLAARYAEDGELEELFSLLARDEQMHETQFKALLKSLPEEQQTPLSESEREYLQALATAEIFYGHNESLDPAFKVESREDALRRALSLEKATLLYYGAMREVLGPDERLDSIIGAEKEHLTQVMKVLFTGAKMRGLSDDFD